MDYHYIIKLRKNSIYTSNKALDKPMTSGRVIWISKQEVHKILPLNWASLPWNPHMIASRSVEQKYIIENFVGSLSVTQSIIQYNHDNKKHNTKKRFIHIITCVCYWNVDKNFSNTPEECKHDVKGTTPINVRGYIYRSGPAKGPTKKKKNLP